MKNIWQLQDAKNRFSNLVNEAQKSGPQIVTKRGEEAVVILSIDDFRKLTQPLNDLVVFFKHSPLAGMNLKIKRDKSPSREIEI